MRISSAILVILAWSSTAAAQVVDTSSKCPDDLMAACGEILCREPHQVHLKLAGGKEFTSGPSHCPLPIVVSGEMITVMAGETVTVEASLEGGRLVNLKAVPKVTHPERTLVLSLRQEPTIGDGLGMILKVENPFPGIFKYRLGMMRPTDERLKKTSSCPLRQSAFEHWPFPLFQVVAADFRQVDPTSPEATRCE